MISQESQYPPHAALMTSGIKCIIPRRITESNEHTECRNNKGDFLLAATSEGADSLTGGCLHGNSQFRDGVFFWTL